MTTFNDDAFEFSSNALRAFSLMSRSWTDISVGDPAGEIYPSGFPPYAIAPAVLNASAALLMDGFAFSVIIILAFVHSYIVAII